MTDQTLVPVAVACLCPGTPHDGDSVYLKPKIGLHGGAVAQRKMIEGLRGDLNYDEMLAGLMEDYVRFGVDSWTLTDEDGDPVPVTPDTIKSHLLDDFAVGSVVADKADDLYSSGLLDPLRVQASTSSRPTRTNGSMSQPRRSSAKPRKQRKSSSTTTSPTDATETTSP